MGVGVRMRVRTVTMQLAPVTAAQPLPRVHGRPSPSCPLPSQAMATLQLLDRVGAFPVHACPCHLETGTGTMRQPVGRATDPQLLVQGLL